MHNKPLAPSAALFAVVLSAIACGGSFTTANIADAWMSTDAEGANRTTVYSPDAVFYAQVDLRNAPDTTVVKAVWTAVSAEGVDPNYVLGETEFETGDAVVTFDLSNDMLWPAGSYKVDLYVDGVLSTTVEFQVQ